VNEHPSYSSAKLGIVGEFTLEMLALLLVFEEAEAGAYPFLHPLLELARLKDLIGVVATFTILV
jgi:hypothetical protein